MPLTRDEAVELDKLLAQLDKRNRGWWLTRWVVLVMGLMWVVLTLWIFGSAWQTARTLIALPNNPTAAASALDVVLVSNSAMNVCFHVIIGFWTIQVSVWLIGFALGNWRKGRRDELLIKLARSCMGICGKQSETSAP